MSIIAGGPSVEGAGAARAARAVKAILEITNRNFRITRAVLLYRLAQFFCFPFIVFYFLARLLTKPAYRPHFGERLGFLPRMFTRTEPGSIWLHAVSVGEVASAIPLLRELRGSNPKVPIYVSTSTVAGRLRQRTNFPI